VKKILGIEKVAPPKSWQIV